MVARTGLPALLEMVEGGETGVGSATRSAPHAPQKESVGLLGEPQLGQREGTVIASDTLANWRATVRQAAVEMRAKDHRTVRLGRAHGTMADSPFDLLPMSQPRPHVAAQARTPARWLAALALTTTIIGCSSRESSTAADGSFGRGVNEYPRDGGMDAAIGALDGGVATDIPSVRVRFVHAMANLGPLRVCHDPDGPGPAMAVPLASDAGALWADFGERSPAIALAPLTTGTLTLQRAALPDAGIAPRDGGPADPCAETERESTIPLPQDGAWLDPRAPLDDGRFEALELARAVAGANALTLVGTGFALNAAALAQRATLAREEALAQDPTNFFGAEGASELERRALEAAFGPRLTIQRDPDARPAATFALSLLHAIPDVATSSDDSESDAVGAVRLCVTAGTREISTTPALPEIPFRYRASLGSTFEAGLEYHFRAYAARDLAYKSCSTISSQPIAERRLAAGTLVAGKVYTLALVGAIAPETLCSPGEASLVRPGCAHGLSALKADIVVFED